MDFTDAKLRTLVAQLGPSIIRIGGTAVDASFYFPSAPYLVGQPNACASCGSGASDIGEAMLTQVFDFIGATGMSLLWDVNGEMARVGTGPWLPAFNFTPMADFLQSRYGGKIDYAYSVGNEPDLWKINKVSTEQLAHDAVTLVGALKAYDIGKEVYGSSFARISTDDAAAFLPIAAAGGVTGYTVHNYPYGGHNCNVSACAFNAHNDAPACTRNCDPNNPKTQPYARLATLNQQTSRRAPSRRRSSTSSPPSSPSQRPPRPTCCSCSRRSRARRAAAATT